MGKRVNTAVWLEKQQRWQIKVQKDGVRRTFTSSKPGRTGQREANRKADAWLDEGISNTTKRCSELWNEFLISVKATAGGSYVDQIEKFGRNYILPVIGVRRIGDLNAGMLQDVLNRAYKEGCLNRTASARVQEISPARRCRASEASRWPLSNGRGSTSTQLFARRMRLLSRRAQETRARRSCSQIRCGYCFLPTHVLSVEKWRPMKTSTPIVWL